MPGILKSALFALLVLVLTGCAGAEPIVEFKGERFTVDLALTREELNRGLMFVEEMEDSHGMLFIFRDQAPRSFWMKNTRIPLDIFYFDQDLKLVSVAENARPCVRDPCPTYPSKGPAMYVLELNAGKARELGAKRGDVLVLLFDP